MKQYQLFSAKEMYAQTHTNKGLPVKWVGKTNSSLYRKRHYDNLLMSQGMTFTQKNELPIIQPYTLSTNFEIHSFKERNKLSGKGQAIHFFGDDYSFDKITWDRLYVTTKELLKFDCVFTPDYSLYVDMPFAYNISNLYKSRFVGAYWQLCGYNVIPTVSWGNADSLKYCFEGIPNRSVLAVCGTGHGRSKSTRKLWEYGMREMEVQLQPILVFVYGTPTSIPGFNTPIKFIEDYITRKLRKAI